MSELIEVKSMGGFNFVRPERVIAIQTSANGSTVIVMDGGSLVNSTESTRALAARFAAAGTIKPVEATDAVS